jgi:hypothetical protein
LDTHRKSFRKQKSIRLGGSPINSDKPTATMFFWVSSGAITVDGAQEGGSNQKNDALLEYELVQGNGRDCEKRLWVRWGNIK